MATVFGKNTIRCPYCGYESEDEELCRACGEVMDDKISVRHVSLGQVIVGFFCKLMGKGIHESDHDDLVCDIFENDPDYDPNWSILSSNINHIETD